MAAWFSAGVAQNLSAAEGLLVLDVAAQRLPTRSGQAVERHWAEEAIAGRVQCVASVRSVAGQKFVRRVYDRRASAFDLDGAGDIELAGLGGSADSDRVFQ